jgi:hypothetical protein
MKVCDQPDKTMSIMRESIVTTCATPYIDMSQGARLKSSSRSAGYPMVRRNFTAGPA